MHYHIDTDTPKQEKWARAKKSYVDVMRDPDKINFVTLFREPRDRLLSFYTFFIEFETLVRTQTRMVPICLKALQTAAVCLGDIGVNVRALLFFLFCVLYIYFLGYLLFRRSGLYIVHPTCALAVLLADDKWGARGLLPRLRYVRTPLIGACASW